jgi:cytochrome c oxidase cbb3-type subunit 3
VCAHLRRVRTRRCFILAVLLPFHSLCQSTPGKGQEINLSPEGRTGQQLFGSMCAGCHGLDGSGGEHAPNIATRVEAQRLGDNELSKIVQDGIPAGGMPGFGSRLSTGQINAVVLYLRVLQGRQRRTLLVGNRERGRELFSTKGGCSECHSIAGEGGFIAPDLSTYGASHSPEEIRTAILDPNRNLDPRKLPVTINTKAGKAYLGLVRNEDNVSLQLQTTDGNFYSLQKSAIAQVRRAKQSLMPADFASRLASSEIDDIVGFLITAAQKRSPGERSEDDE